MLSKLQHLWWASKEKGRGWDNSIRIDVDNWGFEGLDGNFLCYPMSNISEKVNNRNNSIFRGKEEEAWIVWDRAKILSDDFRIHNTVNKPLLPLDPRVQKWEKPPIGYVKINVDVVETDNKIGFGVIIRDCDGFVIGGGTGFKYELTTSEWAGLYALEEGVLLTHSFNVENVIFETDCASIVNRIRKRNKDITVIGHRIKEIRRSMELFSKVE
ncbi:hypothetical protein Gorai_021675, partial [Gossypium raimondii]|nr:hypothetical protein [Gossypium raimondii]